MVGGARKGPFGSYKPWSPSLALKKQRRTHKTENNYDVYWALFICVKMTEW